MEKKVFKIKVLFISSLFQSKIRQYKNKIKSVMKKKEDKYFIFDNEKTINFKHILKVILSPLFDLLYKIILLFYNNKTNSKKYKISICAIFKNEAHNMKEWIEFHKIVGIQHFYMYNNFSEDNYIEVLKSYIEEGLVTLVEWPIELGQFPAYKNFYETYRGETNWVSFLDLDEFITPFTRKPFMNGLKIIKIILALFCIGKCLVLLEKLSMILKN